MKNSYRELDYEAGKTLQVLRTKIGLTQQELGDHLGITARTVRKWEAGESYPNGEHLKALLALAFQHQAWARGVEMEEMYALWKTTRQKRPLDKRWVAALLDQQSCPPEQAKPGHLCVEPGPVEETLTTAQVTEQEQASEKPTELRMPSNQSSKASSLHLTELEEHAPPVIQNLPFPPNPFFTGRESELMLLSHLFLENERIAITQPISISGLGGIGKTQLALEYAHSCHPSVYRSVLWVNAADKASLEASYLSLAHLLQLPQSKEREIDRIVQGVKIWLEEQTCWLLILDNADDLELSRSFLPAKPRGHILLTTRSQIVGDMAALLPVSAMSREEGLLFLLRRSGLLKVGSPLESIASDIRQEALELTEMLSGHPLALDQAGAYIEETSDPSVGGSLLSFTKYRRIYQERQGVFLKRRGSSGSRHPESVALTFEISLKSACQLHPGCADVLSFCSLLHPDAIPEELFSQETGLSLDVHFFDEAIVALRRYSLVKRDSERRLLSVHRLVQAVIRDGMEMKTLQRWTERVVQVLNDAFPEVTFEGWQKCERYLPHALMCTNASLHEAVSLLQVSHLLTKVGTYLRGRGQYADAEPLLVRALSIREQHLGAEHPDAALSLYNLANLYRFQGKYEQAELLYQRALSICEQHLGAEHPNTAKSLNSLANLYLLQGKYERAEPLYQRALFIHEQRLGAEHPNTALSLNDLAALYLLQGKYEQAAPLLKRALAIREQHLGAEHPDTAGSLNNLASLYQRQGKYEQAAPLLKRALAIREQHLGAEHPDTAAGLHNLAVIYQLQGQYERAELLYQRALAIREQLLGAEHPDTVLSLNNLAELYQLQGKYERAEPLYQRALSIHEQRLGAEHPGTAQILHGLAELYQLQGKYEQAEPLYQRALSIREQCLGAEHPSTATFLHGLAELYQQQGKYEQAEPLFQRALAIREKHLGAEHPDTAASLHGLAGLYQQQGKYEQAKALYQRSLHIRERCLGPTHPETEDTRRTYAALLRLVERDEEGPA